MEVHTSQAPGSVHRKAPAQVSTLDSRRGFRWGLVIIALFTAALIAWLAIGHKPPAKPASSPVVAVTTAKVAVRNVSVAINALGSAQAWQGVLIRPQVSGRLLRVLVPEGSEVKAADLVAEIDPAPFRAQLLQTQGALKRDNALLENARLDLNRYRQLAAQDSIAHQQVDTQTALVKQDEGAVMIDQGAVDNARVNLDYTRILAPLAGRAGVRLVDPGNLVLANDATGILTINQVSPIAVIFSIPQGDFQRLSSASNGFRHALATQAFSQETGALLGVGELSIADNHVDASTGTVQMKARFPNVDRRLWPGQLINVRLVLEVLPHVTTVPNVAVNNGPNGRFVFVVGLDNKVSVRAVTLSTTQGDLAVISAGLQPGEVVVSDGQLMLKAGSKVEARQPVSQTRSST